MYNNNYQQFGQRLPPPPSQYKQQRAGALPYGPPASVPPSGTNANQSYSIPPHAQNTNWSQSQHITPPMPYHPNPRIPPPQQQGQPFYRPPPPSLGYFTHAPSGQLLPPPPPSSPPPGPPPLPINFTSDIPSPPPKPRDEKVVRKIELLCHYIAKNGAKFEDMTCQKEVGNPEFLFLFGGPPGSEAAVSHQYYKWMKKKCGSSEGGRAMDMSSKPSVVGKPPSHSPAGSDMDMEDDITQPEKPSSRKSFEPNQADITVEEPSGVIELGTNLSKDDMQFEKSKKKAGVAESEPSFDRKTEQSNTNIHQEINQSAALTEAKVSPFRLIQGYASDNSSGSDDDRHFQNISPEAISRQPKAESDNEFHFENMSPEPVSPQFKENDIEFKNSPQLDRESGPLSVPVVGASLNISSKNPEPSIKQNDRQKGDDTAGPKSGAKRESEVKSKVDEFGRIVREGSSDSGSDHYRRRSKRGRSRSPYGRRRKREKRSRSRSSRSPRRRSRSRSPYRRNQNQIEVCYDNRRGKCFRESCRYFHEPDVTEESRRHKNKQQYHEVSDKSRNSYKLFPEKNEINSQNVVKENFVKPPGHFADEARGYEIKTLDVPSESASADIDPQYQAPPSSVHPKLAPLPPPPPHSGNLPQYQQNQFPLLTNYPVQTLNRPYPMNYLISQQPAGPMFTSPSLASSNLNFSQDPPPPAGGIIQSRIPSHYNPYASTFDQPMSTNFSSGAISQDTYGPSFGQNHIPDEGQMLQAPRGDQYDPLFDSFNPSSNRVLNVEANSENKAVVAVSEEIDEFGETADAEVGAVENDSPAPSSPIDLPDMATGEAEIDQVRNSGKTKKSKDSRSMKLFKVSLAEFVKDVLKPSWKQGNMSKEAFKTIVKKTVDKVSGAMKTHQIPKSQAKISHYIDSSQRKLTKLVMGYVDKYVKV